MKDAMKDFIICLLLTLTLYCSTLVTPAVSDTLDPSETVTKCIATGLPRVIAGEDVTKYIALNSFGLNAIGSGNWKALTEEGKAELMALVLQIIKTKAAAEIQSQINLGLDPNSTSVSSISATEQKNGLFKVAGIIQSPSGIPYGFSATVGLYGTQCKLHGVIVAEVFSITEDIGTDPLVQAFMTKYKLKK